MGRHEVIATELDPEMPFDMRREPHQCQRVHQTRLDEIIGVAEARRGLPVEAGVDQISA